MSSQITENKRLDNAGEQIQAIKPDDVFTQKIVAPQVTLVAENTKITQLILIHEGEIAFVNPADKIVLAQIPVKNFIPVFCQIFSDYGYPLRIITAKPSNVSVYPVNPKQGIQKVIMGKSNLAIMSIQSMNLETNLYFSVFKKFHEFYQRLNNFIVNLALGYFKLHGFHNRSQLEVSSQDPVLSQMGKYFENFMESNSIPEFISKNWLLQNRFYVSPLSENDFEELEFEKEFLKKILTLPLDIQQNIMKHNISILMDFIRKYTKIQSEIISQIGFIYNSITENLNLLLHDNSSILQKFYEDLETVLASRNDEATVSEDETIEVYQYLVENFESISTLYRKSFYKNLQTPANFLKIKENLAKIVQVKQEEQSKIEVVEDNDLNMEIFKESARKIMEFSGIAKEEQEKTLHSLQQLLKLKTPLESDPEIRKLKRPVIETFWKAYGNAYLKYKYLKGNVPRYITLFLLYGYFDENFLEKHHIAELNQLTDTTKPTNPDFSILNSIEWLDVIYERKELPSISELGETYFEFLKQNHQEYSKAKKLSDIPPDIDSAETRVQYEIKNFFSTNAKLVSGSPTTFFPVLTKFHITAPKLSGIFVTKEKLSQQIEELLKIDFSAFYREIVMNDEQLKIFKEFIMVNVFPHIILLPAIGNKSMMWQELEDPRKKDTRARFAFPILSTGDLFQMIIEVTGAFRWEIQRTILGHDYNNIAVPSLTSEYLDYVQFYHKNKELSEEQKEKIKIDFKNFRDDRQKFVYDYSLWIKYESQGILKLNKVVRNIFYRYVPFSKGIRENLQKQPAYADIHNRFKNIRMKKVMELENRWKKYGPKENWPKPLKMTFDYYSL